LKSSKRTLGGAMSDLLQIVKGLSVQPKCVVVLGARTETMLKWLFSLTASQVVLIEPELAMFEKASALHSAKGKPGNVTIIHGVPAIEPEQKTTVYFASNVPGFSSVLPPNVIKSIRPALEFTKQEAPVIALRPLLQQFNISECRLCLLISQLNGGEQQCLNTQIVDAFTHVVIQSSLKPVFGEAKPIEKLKKQLVECGRDYLELTESMPPYFNFVATKKVNSVQALNYFSQKQQQKEIKTALEKQLITSQSEAKKVTEELQQVKEQLQTAKQQADESRKVQSEISQKSIDESNRKNENIGKTLQAVSVLNLKLEGDLTDLREKYSQALSKEREINSLISELYTKIINTSKFLSTLQRTHPKIFDGSDDE
jgi:predicted  nucleic acid-binding Zn-ribbon protein